jgi:hypothetical protein
MATDVAPDLTVVMPCLDEAETVARCVAKALGAFDRLGIRGEVLIADNGSTDGSQHLAQEAGARVVPVAARGYGAALAAGIAAAHSPHVIMGDADDSYDFAAIDPFVERLRAGDELVVGNRFRGGIAPGAMPFLHRYLGNRALTAIAKCFFRSPASDIYCGMRGFERRAIIELDLRSTGMEYAIEMVVKATLHGLRISEVATTLAPDGRSRAPHLRTWRDGWRSLRFLLLYSPTWLFFYPGLVVAGAGGVALLWQLAAAAAPVWMVPSVVAVFVGAQSVLFAAFAKLFAIAEGLLPPKSRTLRVLEHVTLEVGLALSAFVLAAGIALGIAIATSTGGTDRLRGFLVSGTLVALGFQGILASFFLSMLGLRRPENRVS